MGNINYESMKLSLLFLFLPLLSYCQVELPNNISFEFFSCGFTIDYFKATIVSKKNLPYLIFEIKDGAHAEKGIDSVPINYNIVKKITKTLSESKFYKDTAGIIHLSTNNGLDTVAILKFQTGMHRIYIFGKYFNDNKEISFNTRTPIKDKSLQMLLCHLSKIIRQNTSHLIVYQEIKDQFQFIKKSKNSN